MSQSHTKPSQHMHMHPEIKEFTKNTLIFTLFFTLVLHLSWGYIGPYLRTSADASNDAKFTQSQVNYIGNVATALSLSIGRDPKAVVTSRSGQPIGTYGSVSIGELLGNPKLAETGLIANHTNAIQSYVNLLKTDIPTMLEQASDRRAVLDEHIEILKSYYVRTTERTKELEEQASELRVIIADTSSQTASAKATMEEKYKAFETTGVESVISSYISAKEDEARALVYLTYIERFQRGYAILQGHNKKILDTLINNREAIIKNVIVVIPDSGSDLLKKLNLITTEANYKGNSSSTE